MTTTPRPWWTCTHRGIGLPGCPICDVATLPDRATRSGYDTRAYMRQARDHIGQLEGRLAASRWLVADLLAGDCDGPVSDDGD